MSRTYISNINIDSILDKVGSYMNSPQGDKKIQQAINNSALNGSANIALSIYEAAGKFISVLQNEIQSAGLSSGVIKAISQIDHGSAIAIGDGKYMIDIYFSGDMSRPSLDREKYGDINDIVLLFNNGVDHTMHPVHGVWHGRETWSRTVIPETKFIESAIHNFMSNYASEYNVIDIITEGIGI